MSGINAPRVRNGEYEPQLVKKHQTDVSGIEDKVIFLYSEGASTRDIQKTMREIYWLEADDGRVSKITEKLLPVIREWQQRPLAAPGYGWRWLFFHIELYAASR